MEGKRIKSKLNTVITVAIKNLQNNSRIQEVSTNMEQIFRGKNHDYYPEKLKFYSIYHLSDNITNKDLNIYASVGPLARCTNSSDKAAHSTSLVRQKQDVPTP